MSSSSRVLFEQSEAELEHREPEGFVTKNTIRMPFSKNSERWFVWDPCGIVCAVVTYILIVYGELVVLLVRIRLLTSKRVLPKKSAIFPAMASDHISTNYYRAFFKNQLAL